MKILSDIYRYSLLQYDITLPLNYLQILWQKSVELISNIFILPILWKASYVKCIRCSTFGSRCYKSTDHADNESALKKKLHVVQKGFYTYFFTSSSQRVRRKASFCCRLNYASGQSYFNIKKNSVAISALSRTRTLHTTDRIIRAIFLIA